MTHRNKKIEKLALAGVPGNRIAKEVGITRERVRQILATMGLKTKGVLQPYPKSAERKCDRCGKKFTFIAYHAKYQRKYCSSHCRYNRTGK